MSAENNSSYSKYKRILKAEEEKIKFDLNIKEKLYKNLVFKPKTLFKSMFDNKETQVLEQFERNNELAVKFASNRIYRGAVSKTSLRSDRDYKAKLRKSINYATYADVSAGVVDIDDKYITAGISRVDAMNGTMHCVNDIPVVVEDMKANENTQTVASTINFNQSLKSEIQVQ
ncbi:MAG: hypothetical protein N4A47_04090 [Clostridia bacterium]|jgi:hypothetical protein|nr:hypothetical protein [Clostridia bacterium]